MVPSAMSARIFALDLSPIRGGKSPKNQRKKSMPKSHGHSPKGQPKNPYVCCLLWPFGEGQGLIERNGMRKCYTEICQSDIDTIFGNIKYFHLSPVARIKTKLSNENIPVGLRASIWGLPFSNFAF